eukprot:IDg199t1
MNSRLFLHPALLHLSLVRICPSSMLPKGIWTSAFHIEPKVPSNRRKSAAVSEENRFIPVAVADKQLLHLLRLIFDMKPWPLQLSTRQLEPEIICNKMRSTHDGRVSMIWA